MRPATHTGGSNHDGGGLLTPPGDPLPPKRNFDSMSRNDSVAKSDDDNEEEPAQNPGLTLSCSRCRAKKLKCNCETPCSNCVSKGVENECQKDKRIPRGRKKPKVQPPTPQEEMMALLRRLRELEAQTGIQALPNAGLVAHPVDPPTPSASIRSSNTASSAGSSRGVLNPVSQRGSLSEVSSSSRFGSSLSGAMAGPASSSMPSLMEPVLQTGPPNPLQRRDSGLRSLLNPVEAGPSGRSALQTSMEARYQTDSGDATLLSLVSTAENNYPVRQDGGAALADDQPSAYWKDPAQTAERLQLLREARAAAPDESVLEELTYTYLYRSSPFGGHIVYEPTYRATSHYFMNVTPEDAATSSVFVDPCCMSIWFLVLCIAYHFHPHNVPAANTPGFKQLQAMRAAGVDPTIRWYDLARRAFAIEHGYWLKSVNALQAACLFITLGQGNNEWLRMVAQMTVVSARDMGLHRLGTAQCVDGMTTAAFVRLETAVRIWNFLCVRDWCMSQGEGVYTINPTHYTTRRPLNLNDADLKNGMTQSRPSTDWTELSFVLAQIELANRVREAVDMRNTHRHVDSTDGELSRASIERIDENFWRYLRQLPHFFAIGSTYCTPRVIAPQRWFLHQQVFNQLLILHKADLDTDSAGRASCMALAESVLKLFREIRNVCPLIEAFYTCSTIPNLPSHLGSLHPVSTTDPIISQEPPPPGFYAASPGYTRPSLSASEYTGGAADSPTAMRDAPPRWGPNMGAYVPQPPMSLLPPLLHTALPVPHPSSSSSSL